MLLKRENVQRANQMATCPQAETLPSPRASLWKGVSPSHPHRAPTLRRRTSCSSRAVCGARRGLSWREPGECVWSTQHPVPQPGIDRRHRSSSPRPQPGGRLDRGKPRTMATFSHRYRGSARARRTKTPNNTGSGSINLACRSEAHALISLWIDQPLLSAENIPMTECS